MEVKGKRCTWLLSAAKGCNMQARSCLILEEAEEEGRRQEVELLLSYRSVPPLSLISPSSLRTNFGAIETSFLHHVGRISEL